MTNDRFQRGLANRTEVLGEDYVNAAMQHPDPFSAPMQHLVTEYCWGEVWDRDGLDRRTRSLLNVAMLAILNRPRELAIHVRGALRNGATEMELQETLLQVAVYAGVPAGMDSFRVASEAVKSLSGDG